MPAAATENTTLKAHFAQAFGPGGKIHVIRAPGRINLIGEHTDYNDGFVLPMAIEPQVLLACRGRDDGTVRIASTAFPGVTVQFSVQEKIRRGEPAWSNYCRGMAAELLAAGIPLVGMDAMIGGSLPVGGGLSSSAAMEIGTGLSLLTLAGLSMDPGRLALIAQRAEHEFAGVPVGMMDMTIISVAKPGQAMLLDCRSLARQFIPIDSNEIRLIVMDTKVKHDLATGQYAQRRRECEEGVAFFARSNPSINALRDLTMKQLESARNGLSDAVFRRCRHVISENARTQEFAALIEKRHYEIAGQHMLQSHESLRDDYQVSCDELDFLVQESMNLKGVYGARLTGGGFGGCAIAMVQARAAAAFCETIAASYRQKFNVAPTVFATSPTGGASMLE